MAPVPAPRRGHSATPEDAARQAGFPAAFSRLSSGGMNRHLLSLVPGLLVPAGLAYAFHATLNLGPGYVWLFGLNLTLFALMGKDKFAARRKGWRTPEFTLLALAFLGGTPALLAGQKLFRHKTAKRQFIYAQAGTVFAQFLCIWYFWPQLRPLF